MSARNWAVAGKSVDPDDSRLLLDIVRAILAREQAAGWTVDPGDFWCRVTPPRPQQVDQGWKLHISATHLAAPLVLARSAKVLIHRGCAFKFARDLDQLAKLLSAHCDRGSGGKFITAYPADDAQFRLVAAELERATDGLPGPAILSDRRLRPGSIVFYRFGVFNATSEFTNDGIFESRLVGPDGERSKDERPAWFSPPRWAEPPLPEPARADLSDTTVLIDGRFLVSKAIQQSYRGGVYSGIDQKTGNEVVLKRARPHVMSSLTGADACDELRHEAEILDLLAPLGIAPRKLALVSQQENLFLAEELIPGATLRDWAAERSARSPGRGVPLPDVIDKAGRLVELMDVVHQKGLVLRDFTPANLMVMPDGRIRLIDVEFVVADRSRAHRAFTRGYAAPEQLTAPKFGPAPSQRVDLFSLGATLVHLISGVDPLLPDDETSGRPGEERLAEFVRLMAVDMPALHRLSPLVRGLMKDDPEKRWTLAQAREFLAGATKAGEPADGTLRAAKLRPGEASLPVPLADRLITDGMEFILRTMDQDSPRLWSSGEFGDQTDPCNVQYGAAGVLSVLTRGQRVLADDRLLAGVAAAAGWLQKRLFDIPRILPGLYFGRSGMAWALHEAALLLADEQMSAQAIELAKQVPVSWPNPDICHGAAGAGMAQLRLWKSTGDPEFEKRFIEAADSVLAAAREQDDGLLVWPIPKDFRSDLAGLVHYGFAHGVAGAGTFLLYSWLATGRAEYLRAAVRAGETLAAVADIDGDAAWWPSGERGDSAAARLRHWCSGSSGVGTFLIRLWAVTGEQRFRELSEAAGVAIRQGRWHSGLSACHGLAGDGDFLIDLAEFTGEHQRYQAWAADLATAMYARHTMRDGLMVLPDDSGNEFHASYNTGLGGALTFLLRLRHGGPRLWMLDEFLALPRPSRSCGSAPIFPRR